MRRHARFDASLAALTEQLNVGGTEDAACGSEGIEDDRLRLIFTFCHPALPADAQTAMTLRELCGLTTEEIPRAYRRFSSSNTGRSRTQSGEQAMRGASETLLTNIGVLPHSDAQ